MDIVSRQTHFTSLERGHGEEKTNTSRNAQVDCHSVVSSIDAVRLESSQLTRISKALLNNVQPSFLRCSSRNLRHKHISSGYISIPYRAETPARPLHSSRALLCRLTTLPVLGLGLVASVFVVAAAAVGGVGVVVFGSGTRHIPVQSAPPLAGSQVSVGSSKHCCPPGHPSPWKPPHCLALLGTQMPAPSHATPQPRTRGSDMQRAQLGHDLPPPPPGPPTGTMPPQGW